MTRKRDPRVDICIAAAADFAKPILRHIRKTVHAACPDVEETLKWGHPSFMYNGVILCGMAAFNAHCRFHIWKGGVIRDRDGAIVNDSMHALKKVSDLPRQLESYIKQAVKLRQDGVSVRKKKRAPKPALPMPADLSAALKRYKKAAQAFEKFSPRHRREYIEWITEAKRAETRERRIAQTVEWLEEGKARNWKYK